MSFAETTQLVANSWGILLGLILALILFRLYQSRRTLSYLHFGGFFLFVTLQYLYALTVTLFAGFLVNWSVELQTINTLFRTFSVLLLSYGIYRLYNAQNVNSFFSYWGALVVSTLIYLPVLFGPASWYLHVLHLYYLLLTGAAFWYLRERVEHRFLYNSFAITMIMDALLSTLAPFIRLNFFWGLTNYLQPLAIVFLLLLLIDRVVVLMQSATTASITDGLTRLYNRRYFYSYLDRQIKMNATMSAIFIDIDNFKKLNDTKGHDMGDQALRQVAGIAQSVAEGIGIVGRYGGEEIVMLVTDPGQDVGVVAERWRSRVERETIVTISVGYAAYTPGITSDDFLKRADLAMYKSKTTGKNKVTNYADLVSAEGAKTLDSRS